MRYGPVYTDVVLFYFFFVLFENIGERARMSAVNKSPAVSVLFYRPRSTDFEEKIEGL